MSYIDLSHQINTNTPVYPGDPKVKIEAAGVLTRDGFADSLLTLGTHVGTHIDAPAHMINDGKTLDQYPIETFTGRVLVHDIQMDIISLEGIDAVFFYTGASDRYDQASYWEDFPVLNSSQVDSILSSGVKIVGVDTGSVDNQDGFPIHKALLGRDILILENLTNLKQLAGKTVDFTALPLNLQLDGAPCRVIAKI